MFYTQQCDVCKQPGRRSALQVSLFSENSSRWLVADQAIMLCGAADAVRGASSPPDELAYIVRQSDSSGDYTSVPQCLVPDTLLSTYIEACNRDATLTHQQLSSAQLSSVTFRASRLVARSGINCILLCSGWCPMRAGVP